MSSDLRDQIYNNLNLKDTNELLEIWQENNRGDWSDLAFGVIAEILQRRLAQLPPQDEAIYIHSDPEDNGGADEDEVADPDNKFLDEDNTPVFYKPRDVLFLVNRLQWAALASVVLSVVIFYVQQFQNLQVTYSSFFLRAPQFAFIGTLLALGFIALEGVVVFLGTYLPLRALAVVLNILMEMEFNSRNAR